MKKFIVLSIVLVLVSSTVFALPDGFGVGAWGRAVFAPLIARLPADKDTYNARGDGRSGTDSDGKPKDAPTAFTGTGVTWGNSTSLGIAFTFTSDAVGAKLAFKGDTNAGSAGLDEENYAYVKPFSNDLLTIKVGAYNVDDLRGKIGGDWQDNGFIAFHANSGSGEDAIFQRFLARVDNPGAIIYSKPIDPLFIGINWNANGLFTNDVSLQKKALEEQLKNAKTDAEKMSLQQQIKQLDAMPGKDIPGGRSVDTAEQVWSNIQLGVGYTIENVGQVRAGFFGAYKSSPYIQAAFNYTGVEGLNLDAGVKVSIPYKDPDVKNASTTNNAHGLSVGAKYTSGALGVAGRIDATLMPNYVKVDAGDNPETWGGMGIGFSLEPWYDLGMFKVGATFGLKIVGAAHDKIDGKDVKDQDKGAGKGYTDIGFGLFLSKDYAQGNLTTGVALGLPRGWADTDKANWGIDPAKMGITTISIPVILTYSF